MLAGDNGDGKGAAEEVGGLEVVQETDGAGRGAGQEVANVRVARAGGGVDVGIDGGEETGGGGAGGGGEGHFGDGVEFGDNSGDVGEDLRVLGLGMDALGVGVVLATVDAGKEGGGVGSRDVGKYLQHEWGGEK